MFIQITNFFAFVNEKQTIVSVLIGLTNYDVKIRDVVSLEMGTKILAFKSLRRKVNHIQCSDKREIKKITLLLYT